MNWRRRAKRHLRSCLLHLCSPFLPDFPFLDRHVTWLPLRMYLRLYSICVCVYVCVCAYISCGCPVICKARHGISLLDTFQLFPSVAWSGGHFVPPTIYPVFLSSCSLPLAGNLQHVTEYIGSKNSLCFLYFPFRNLRGVATDSNYTGWNSKHSLFALKNLKSTE